jgi:bifunctional DNase/RNase
MVQVRVANIAVDVRGQHVLLLKPVTEPPGTGRVLPVWIGQAESTSILFAIEGATPPRPLSHDLMKLLLESVGADVERVEITRIEDGTFYAELTLRTPNGRRVLDCRPSDAIAIAARMGVRLEVADEVLESAGVEDEFTTPEDEAEEVEEFRHFLDEVDPDDFRGSG